MTLSGRLLKLFVRDEAHLVSPREEKTFYLDTIRSGVDGISKTLTDSVFLLIAIQYFDVNDFWKSIISSSIHFGMVLSLFTTALFHKNRPPQVVSLATMGGGVLLVCAGFTRMPPAYGLFILVHGLFLHIRMPLLTAIYAENYHPKRRGKLFSGGVLLALATGIISNILFGIFLDRSMENFRIIFAFSGFLMIVSGMQIRKIPFRNSVSLPRSSPLKNLSLLYRNPLFGLVSLSWFIMGFANLWNIPLRTVYLAESERGMGLSPLLTLIIIGVIPSAVRFIFSNFWAHIYDKISFLYIRMIGTGIISVGTLLFFMTKSIPLIILAQIIMHIGFSASPFLWNLWVTKVAPPGESQAYMSVHTFLCGVRGILGPFMGFLFLRSFSMKAVGFVSFALFMVSIIILAALRNHPLIKNNND